MIKRELWEIVRADELKVGDVINRHGDPELPETVLEINRIPGHVLIQTDGVFAKLGLRSKLFHRISNADDPRVSLKALELALFDMEYRVACSGSEYAKRPVPSLDDYLDRARRELESEGSDDQA